MNLNYTGTPGFFPIFPKWTDIKERLKRFLGRERVFDLGLAAVTLLLLSILFYALTKAINDYTIKGP